MLQLTFTVLAPHPQWLPRVPAPRPPVFGPVLQSLPIPPRCILGLCSPCAAALAAANHGVLAQLAAVRQRTPICRLRHAPPKSNRWTAIGPRVYGRDLSIRNGQITGEERTKNGWGMDEERICKAGTDLPRWPLSPERVRAGGICYFSVPIRSLSIPTLFQRPFRPFPGPRNGN